MPRALFHPGSDRLLSYKRWSKEFLKGIGDNPSGDWLLMVPLAADGEGNRFSYP